MQNKIFRLVLLTCLVIASSISSYGQYFPATVPDISAGAATEPLNVNCDHAEFALVSPTRVFNYNAIAFDTYPAGGPYVVVFLNLRGFISGTGNTFARDTIWGATRPDIILGSDASGQFYAGVVYELNGQINYTEYTITPTISGSAATGVTLNPSTRVIYAISSTGRWPHIDGFVDASGLSTAQCFAVSQYAISWQDNSGASDTMKAAYNTFPSTSAPSAVSGLNKLMDNIIRSDISGYVDEDGSLMANLIYTRTNSCGDTQMWVETKNIQSTTLLSSMALLEANAGLRAPRIESQCWHPTGNGYATWMAVCPKYISGTGFYEPWEYNSKNYGAALNLMVLPNTAGNYEAVGISGTCGEQITGPLAYSYPGPSATPFPWNDSMGFMLYPNGYSKLKFGVVSADGGSGGLSPQAYGPNINNQVAPRQDFPVAAASSTSSGHNMLVAWGTHISVSYKLVYDTIPNFHFRPGGGSTGVDEIDGVDGGVAVYANPTVNNVFVKGVDHGTYVIYDLAGKKLAEGKMNEGEPIQTEFLVPGTYMLNVNEGDKTHNLRFVKQ